MPHEENQSQPGPAQVILMAETSHLAGDLEAWFSGIFAVQRTRDLRETLEALRPGLRALVVVAEDAPDIMRRLPALAARCVGLSCRLVVLGGDPAEGPVQPGNLVTFLPSFPDPGLLLATLNQEIQPTRETES